jgi:hypothetical protein
MFPKTVSLFLFALLSAPSFGQSPSATADIRRVTYVTSGASVFDALIAIALQAGSPIGVEFGQDQGILCNRKRSFDISEQLPYEAFSQVLSGTGYTIKEHNGVFLVTAQDLTGQQRALLDFKYDSFPGAKATMAGLGAQLTGWMRMEAEHVPAFAASVVHSESSSHVQLHDFTSASTEEIANAVVRLDAKGIWLFRKAPADSQGAADEELVIYSYSDDLQAIKNLSCTTDTPPDSH